MTKFKSSGFRESFYHAFRGLRLAFNSQRNFVIEIFIACIVTTIALVLKFSPSDLCILFIMIAMVLVSEMLNSIIEFTLDAISSLDVGNVIFADPNFTITDIVDLYTKEENQTLTMGKPAKITGTKLKLGDENSGIFFAPIDTEEEIISDESTWIKVPQESIFRNKPTELNFFVPETLESGKSYCIVLKTNYISNSQTRKEILETESAPIKIV